MRAILTKTISRFPYRACLDAEGEAIAVQVYLIGSDDDSAHLVKLSSEPSELSDNVHQLQDHNDSGHQLGGHTHCHDKVAHLSHRNTVFAVDISDDGKFLATGCSGESLKIWSICSTDKYKVISKEEVHDLGIVSVCFKKTRKDDPAASDYGRYTLASGGNDNYIKIWSYEAEGSTLELLQVVSGHSGNVLCLAFSNTGEFLGSASGDKTAKIWETDHYTCLMTFGNHSRYVTCCAFSGDCKLFVTGCERSFSVWGIDLESKKNSGKPAFENLPISQWSSRDVKDWLKKEGFGAHLTTLSPRLDSGPALLSTSQMVLTSDLGLDKESASRLVQLVQWARFGGRRGEIEEAEIPEEFICPITCDVMRNPVKCSDGFVYEESAIKEWLLTRRNTSPLTNLELKVVNLVAQPDLLARIREFVQEDGNRF